MQFGDEDDDDGDEEEEVGDDGADAGDLVDPVVRHVQHPAATRVKCGSFVLNSFPVQSSVRRFLRFMG